jgi:hypothetical protein
MAKEPPKHYQPWKPAEVQELRALAKGNTPTGLVAHKLGRSEDAVRNKASQEGISLRPTNRSPYNRRRK